MRQHIVRRVTDCAQYMMKTGATVRRCAEQFGISKTTVHKDMRERLAQIDPRLARAVDVVLTTNRQERHIRGGQATKRKYQHPPPNTKG